MRVLYITLGLPYPPLVGAQIRDFELYRRIAERHRVGVLALTEAAPPPEHVRALERFVERVVPVVVPTALTPRLLARVPGHLARGWPLATLPFVHRRALAAIRRETRAWGPDLVQVEHSFLAPYHTALAGHPTCCTALSLHNVGEVQYDRMRETARGVPARPAAWMKSRAMRGWEAPWCRRFDRVIVVSAEDRDHLLRQDPSLRVAVVPNGVDTASRASLPPPRGAELLFVGNLAYGPNAEAVRAFCDVVFPLVQQRVPHATLTVVGPDPPPGVVALGRQPGISVTGAVREVRPYYERAAVCVVPLQAGGGTRIKILEAMALGRPVVSTTVGCEGLAARRTSTSS